MSNENDLSCIVHTIRPRGSSRLWRSGIKRDLEAIHNYQPHKHTGKVYLSSSVKPNSLQWKYFSKQNICVKCIFIDFQTEPINMASI